MADRYAELQALRFQGYEDSRKLGYSSVDLAMVEREIAKYEKQARRAESYRRWNNRRVQQVNAWGRQIRASH